MKKIPLKISFLLALIMALFGTVFFPSVRLIAFAPFLALVYARSSFVFSLWIALICGLIIDIFSSELRFGLYALNYCTTTLLIFHQKRHFFDDKPLALSLYTALISFTSTLLQLVLLYMFGKSISMKASQALINLTAMPLLDAAYAFLWFTCPVKIYHYLLQLKQRIELLQKEPEEEE